MDDPTDSPPTDDLADLVFGGTTEDAVARLGELETAAADDRKEAVRALRSLADDRPAAFESLCPALAGFLDDGERAVRLSTAKLFATLAEADPDAVRPIAPSLADRLADAEEFYYVRARAAEALGYVALEHPDEVASPETLADLRIGLSFDEPAVKEKLSKALAYVALGDPGRLDHQVSNLADHLDDDNELVRYHLCTVLVIVGCESPEKLAAATDELEARLGDENAYVRGRAAEAFGLLDRSDADEGVHPSERLERLTADEEPFVAERARFAVGRSGDAECGSGPDGVGTIEGIRGTTEGIVEGIASPDSDRKCPHCGLELPADGPPMCPRCGAPH